MRKDATFGQTDEEPQDEDLGADEGGDEAEGKRFSREAKFGLSVILGLMLILGGVVVWRMTAGQRHAEEVAAIAKETGQEKERELQREREKEAARARAEEHKRPFSPPTVVSANSAPAKPLMDANRWNALSAADGRTPGTGPELMPAHRDGEFGGERRSEEGAGPLHHHPHHEPEAGELGAQSGPGFADAAPLPPRPREGRDFGASAENPLREQYGTAPGAGLNRPEGIPRYGMAPNPAGPAEAYAAAGAGRYGPASTPRYGYADGGDPREALLHRPHADFSARRGEPPAVNDGTYKVQPNDSFWTVSEKVYGTGAYFKALVEVNRSQTQRDDRLQLGTVLATPPAEELQKKYPDLCPKPGRHQPPPAGRAMTVSTRAERSGQRVYVVEEGDTLYDIARYELGKAARWSEIWEMNRELIGDDAGYLAPGTRLVLPDAQPADTLTRQPGPGRFSR